MNSDKAIERVLTGLREAETPIGMERRILEAVQDRASVKSARAPLWTWGVAVACTIAVCVAISVIYRTEHVSVQSNMHSIPAEALPPAASEEVAKGAQLPEPGSTSRLKGKVNVRRARVVRNGDSAAVREMHAASYPAPPMPLTEQEKLLLRVAHRGDPEEIAMLNNEARAKQEAEGKTEFQRFFEPATTGDNE